MHTVCYPYGITEMTEGFPSRLNIFSFLALAGEGARDNAPSGFPWQWRGPSVEHTGPTACCHRAEPANAPKTEDYRRSQLPSYLKSGPSNEPGCAGDTSAGAVRGVVGAVCLQEVR